jgi:MFS family permease
MTTTPPKRANPNFWKFWSGQTLSNLGSSITLFALPLLVYQLTDSAFNLALASTFGFLPYLLFGLIIGAWVDRTNRKRLMIAVDLLRMLVLLSVPVLVGLDALTLWWIYAVAFINGTLTSCFQAAEFAAIPSLVDRADLVTANGRIQASYSAAMVIGPLLAGLLVGLMPLAWLLALNAATFAISALLLHLIHTSFNAAEQPRSPNILHDISAGLRYVWSHPVLRNISIMMALVNLFGSTAHAQLVLFASTHYQASESQVGLFFSAGALGVVLLSLAAGPLRKRFRFSTVALGALMLEGLLLIALTLTQIYWLGLIIWALAMGLGILFNINTGSLRQAIVPGHLLGRVISVAMVLAWSVIPVGTLLGGLAIERTGNVSLVYAAIGLMTFLIPLGFWLTPIGRAERYLPATPADPVGGADPEPVTV